MEPTDSPLCIVVGGFLGLLPAGGVTWDYLQYPLGLARLGHEVWFAEDSDSYDSCYDPVSDAMGRDPAYGLEFAAHAFALAGLDHCWGYFDDHTNQWLGPAGPQMPALAAGADLLLNLSGVNPLRDWAARIPVRAYVDTDPVFTQVRHCTEPQARDRAGQHTAFFTFAENFVRPDCTIPDDGFAWVPTRQPVMLDIWQVTPGPPQGPLSTVMQWESYARREYQGRHYGMKADSFQEYLDLPGRSGEQFRLALGGRTAPGEMLGKNGWQVVDSRGPTRTPDAYREFIAASKGEFSVAKHGYVLARTGWFSERSAAYLASGRPVVTQDTGFSRILPTGRGLLTFSSPNEAVEAIDRLNTDYPGHCRAARQVAEEYFDARTVLAELLDKCIGRPGSGPAGRRGG